MNMNIILANGGDRYGAHISRYISEYLFYESTKTIYISRQFKYYNELFFKPFIFLCQTTQDIAPKTNFPDNKYGYVGTNIVLLKKIKQDIPSYFKSTNLYKIYMEIIPKNRVRKKICVHLRLDDCSYYIPKKSNLIKKGEAVLNHINSNFTTEMDMTVLENVTPWIQQHNCNLNLLYTYIENLQNKYGYDVDVITSPKPENFVFPNSFKDFNIIRNLNVNDSILFMIHSDILVLSASTIAYTAGLLHKGTQIYYPYWNHYFSYGLSSNLDKSNWIMYNI
jgi:hypothetical protein